MELEHENQPVTIPQWVGDEVTSDERYFNVNLAVRSFSEW
jgi:adenylate cyclase